MSDMSAQLIEQVMSARAAGTALNIQGNGSKAFLGRHTPEREEHAPLNVGEHTGIVSYQPVELVLTARAGTRLAEIEQVLDEQGQMLAFEPPQFTGNDTLGGTLACHLSGPGRPWLGSVRDHVLGIRLINGNAEHLRFGGQVMKNVAGYDVSRLQAGAMGTLGVITEVSLKVLPKPQYSVTLTQEMDAAEAIKTMNQRAAVAKPLTAACWVDGVLYTRLSGAESAVAATVKQWGGAPLSDAASFWTQLRDQQLGVFPGSEGNPTRDTPLWRFSVKSTAALFDLEGSDRLAAGQQIIDWGGAQRWLTGSADFATLQAIAKQAGGEVSQCRGIQSGVEVFQTPVAPLQQIQQRLKQSFDPKGIFNPGRLYAWL